MQNFNIELFSRLFLFNLAKNFKIDENFSIISDQSPSASSQAEPPTPPRTPIIASLNNQSRSGEKNHNNNNDDAKENFEGNSSSLHNSPVKFSVKSVKSENEFEDIRSFKERRSSQFNDDSNFSDDEHGERESVVSGSLQTNGAGDESEHESDCASSFDSSKLSLKNIENFLDKSPMVNFNTFDASNS